MERWEPIEGSRWFAISDTGRIWNMRFNEEQKLRLQNGYPAWTYHSAERRVKTVYVHRLVAYAFLGEPDGKREVCHNNGVKTDNRVENLRWDTHKANQEDMVKHGHTRLGTGKVPPPRVNGAGETEYCCTGCGEWFTAEGFYRAKRRSSGIQAACKNCTKEMLQRWRRENPERAREVGNESKRRLRDKYFIEAFGEEEWLAGKQRRDAHRLMWQNRVKNPLRCSVCGVSNWKVKVVSHATDGLGGGVLLCGRCAGDKGYASGLKA